jgi:hypothetical protein
MHALLSLSLVQGWSHALSFSLVKLGSQDAPVAPLLMLAVKYEPKPTWSPSHNTGTLHRARQAVQHCSVKKMIACTVLLFRSIGLAGRPIFPAICRGSSVGKGTGAGNFHRDQTAPKRGFS